MSTRPRGFMPSWNPHPETLKLVEDVKTVLWDNKDILPLTLRQIFYMLFSDYGYEKTEKQYKKLCETMNKARRSRMISMEDIRDDGLREQTPQGWDSADQFIDAMKYHGQRLRRDRQDGQPQHTMVWCEAAGMLPQLAAACKDWGVPVLSSGGFDSVTTKHNLAERISEMGNVEILHIGDHDPSGVHMFKNLQEDLGAFVAAYGGDLTMTRLAVTPYQIEDMSLPQAPAKRTDNRSFEGLTTQAEAIRPRDLRTIVTDAIKRRIDHHIYDEVLRRELAIRAELEERLRDV